MQALPYPLSLPREGAAGMGKVKVAYVYTRSDTEPCRPTCLNVDEWNARDKQGEVVCAKSEQTWHPWRCGLSAHPFECVHTCVHMNGHCGDSSAPS